MTRRQNCCQAAQQQELQSQKEAVAQREAEPSPLALTWSHSSCLDDFEVLIGTLGCVLPAGAMLLISLIASVCA